MSDRRIENRAFSKTARCGCATGTRPLPIIAFPYGSFTSPDDRREQLAGTAGSGDVERAGNAALNKAAERNDGDPVVIGSAVLFAFEATDQGQPSYG